jgi:hypothetical protein
MSRSGNVKVGFLIHSLDDQNQFISRILNTSIYQHICLSVFTLFFIVLVLLCIFFDIIYFKIFFVLLVNYRF